LHLEQKFARFAEKPAADRLVEVLLSFAEHYGRPASESSAEGRPHRGSGTDYMEIALPLTNLQLAERVGVTPETLSALLADLKSKEVVRRKGRRFLVRVDRLRKLCRV
jgi:CRP-like cAMP-binding protein